MPSIAINGPNLQYLFNDGRLAAYVQSLGPAVAGPLMERLRDMHAHPEKYPDSKWRIARRTLIELAPPTDDPRLIEVLALFANDPVPDVAGEAKGAIRALERRKSSR